MNLPGSLAQVTEALAVQASTRLYICLLGGFRIFQGEKQLSGDQIHLHKARDLLKLLALAPNHRLLREQVLEKLWPDHSPEDAAHNLSQTLYILRPKVAELEPSAQILFEEEYLVLRVNGGISTDVEIFERAARLALNHAGPVNDLAAAYCQEAIVVYTGDLLPEDGSSDLFYQRRDMLHKIYLDVLLQIADYHLANQEYLSAIETLQMAIANDPTNEEAQVRLMRSYALNGQRQAALRQYQSLAEALRNDLDVEPSPESQQLRELIASSEMVPKAPPIEWRLIPQHNLPVLISSFIGRDAEIDEVRRILQANRLVTLTGSGGIGKTRLALKVAECLLDDFPHGVFWVELATLTNPLQVAKTILDVFRLPEQDHRSETERLVDFLKGRHLLLLLDNCELLTAACSTLIEILLKSCPHLQILVTSRVSLKLPGEITYRVPSLAIPNPNQSTALLELAHYDAVRLFCERANRYVQDFTLTARNAAGVTYICQQLDGIPLALELAAARSRLLTIDQIADQLKDAFHLLRGSNQAVLSRHKTLLASIEWSYHLLSSKERLLLHRLAVFSGSCDLEAVEDIGSGEGIDRDEVLDLLEGLVDHSMVIADTHPERPARYHLLETVRQYAHAILIESKDLERMDQRHLAYYLRFAEQADQEIRGPRQLTWLKRLEQERSNIASALERSLSAPSHALEGVRLACALTWYWGMIWNFAQARYYMQMVLPHIADIPKSSLKAAILFQIASASAWGMDFLEPQAAMTYIKESLSIWQAQKDDTALQEAQCLLTQGLIMTSNKIGDQGLALMCKCCDSFQQIGDPWWQAWATNLISGSREEQGEDAQAVRAILLKETMLWRKAGDRYGEAIPIMAWGQYALKHGDFVEAQTYLLRSLTIFEEIDALGWMTQITRDLGHAARALQEFDQADYYYKRCEQLIQASGWSMLRYYVHCGRGFTALHLGDYRRAEQFFKEAFRMVQQFEARLVFWIAGFASLYTIRNQPEAAAQLFGALFALKDTYQINIQPADQIEINHFLPLCQAKLEKPAFDLAWEIGQAMTMEQLALSVLISDF